MTGLDQEKGLNPDSAMGASNLDQEQAVQDIQNIKDGKPVDSKGIPGTDYIKTFVEFVNSGELQNLSPELQKKFIEFVQELKQRVDQHSQNQQQQPPMPQGQPPQMPPQQPAMQPQPM